MMLEPPNQHWCLPLTNLGGGQYNSTSVYQGNLKGESVVAAILPSCMEMSYCTSGFFHSSACQAISLIMSCLFRVDLNHACLMVVIRQIML